MILVPLRMANNERDELRRLLLLAEELTVDSDERTVIQFQALKISADMSNKIISGEVVP
jgi:hypothetical protein